MVNCWSEARRHSGLPHSSPPDQAHCLDYLTPNMATALLRDLTSDSRRLFFSGQSGQVIPPSSFKPEKMSLCPGRLGDLLQPIAASVNNGHAAAPAHQAPEACSKMHFWGHVPASCSGSGPGSEVEWRQSMCARLKSRTGQQTNQSPDERNSHRARQQHPVAVCTPWLLQISTPTTAAPTAQSLWAPQTCGRRGGWKKTLCSLQCSASRILPACKCVSCCLQDILKRQC